MTQSKTLFSHPFSAAYWKLAWAQTRNLRILTLAALCMALKMAVASFRIPVGDQLYIYFTYLITAVQCAVCGPVVGVLCGGIGDLIEFAIAPNGPFFPGYTLSSMAGALVFGLFLFHARITVWRLILSRLIINLGVNVLMGSLWSYLLYSHGYLYYFFQSLIKNTLLLPLEVILLVFFFRMLSPFLQRRGWIVPQQPRRSKA